MKISAKSPSSIYLGQSATTPLTPNSQAVTSTTGDPSQDTTVKFETQRVPYWTALVSNGNTQVVLEKDVGSSVVTFKRGLTVQFLAQSQGQYIVTATGEIADGGSTYQLTGKFLGCFNIGAAAGRVNRVS